MGGDLLAHGLGGAKDLPIPPSLAIAGSVAALVVSFTVLAVAWRTPRYDPPRPGWQVPGLERVVDSGWFDTAARVVGLLLFGYALVPLLFGQDLLINPFFGMFYVLLWVGIVPVSLLLGPVWRAVNPLRTLAAGLRMLTGSREPLAQYPARWGYWPAALALFAFVWMELVYPHSTELGPVRLWVAAYVVVMLVGGLVFGDRFFDRADGFQVYSTLVAHLSVWGRDQDGRLVVRSPLANLATVPVLPGLVAVVAVLFGSTAYDSFRESSEWLGFVQTTGDSAIVWNNLALLGFCVLAGVVFAVGTAATGVGPGTSRRDLPGLFAHSLVPIIVGYIAAHYLSYLVEYGQTTLIQMSDPLSRGDNWFGTADLAVDYWLSYHPTFLANTKVLGVVVGHVLAVVAAHDRALRLLPVRHQLTGQLPLLLAMVGFTAGGLFLLFAA